jgi:transposase InsO family protein
VGSSLKTILPLTALNRAIALRPPSPGLVHHSDGSTQYASNDHVRRLEECQITISMSRPAQITSITVRRWRIAPNVSS